MRVTTKVYPHVQLGQSKAAQSFWRFSVTLGTASIQSVSFLTTSHHIYLPVMLQISTNRQSHDFHSGLPSSVHLSGAQPSCESRNPPLCETNTDWRPCRRVFSPAMWKADFAIYAYSGPFHACHSSVRPFLLPFCTAFPHVRPVLCSVNKSGLVLHIPFWNLGVSILRTPPTIEANQLTKIVEYFRHDVTSGYAMALNEMMRSIENSCGIAAFESTTTPTGHRLRCLSFRKVVQLCIQ